jgi:hypothetical protein
MGLDIRHRSGPFVRKIERKEMKIIYHRMATVGFALLLFVTIGCRGQRPMQTSGFLSSYTGMEKGSDISISTKSVDWGVLNSEVDFNAYQKVLIEHVELFLADNSPYAGMEVAELKTATDAFHESLIQELSSVVQIVDAPGDGVMRMRIAITRLGLFKPRLRSYNAVVPLDGSFRLVPFDDPSSDLLFDRAAIEVELLDSKSRARLAAGIIDNRSLRFKDYKKAEPQDRVPRFMSDVARDIRSRIEAMVGSPWVKEK